MSVFFDTNILIYGLVPGREDDADAAKRATAARLIDQCAERDDLVISGQVMSEFFVVSTKKGRRPLSPSAATLVLEEMSVLKVVAIDKELVLQAAVRMVRSQISYWDALIVEAALRAGATILYSEDMGHGMRFDSVEVRNPFLV